MLSGLRSRMADNMAQGTARGLVSLGPEQEAFLQAIERARAMGPTNKLLQSSADAATALTVHGTRNKLLGR
jgi:hypothetical protein